MKRCHPAEQHCLQLPNCFQVSHALQIISFGTFVWRTLATILWLWLLQDFGADVLFGDWAYYCTPALSEMLKIPRVTVSNIPILDPVHTTWDRSTGRRMHAANILAYTPQVHP